MEETFNVPPGYQIQKQEIKGKVCYLLSKGEKAVLIRWGKINQTDIDKVISQIEARRVA